MPPDHHMVRDLDSGDEYAGDASSGVANCLPRYVEPTVLNLALTHQLSRDLASPFFAAGGVDSVEGLDHRLPGKLGNAIYQRLADHQKIARWSGPS